MNNKKVLIISIVAVFILVVAIVATSYATFTANLTGTKENKIQTGYVKMNCEETTMSVTDTQPLSDADGIASTNNVATCTLSVTMQGTMKLGYDVGFDEVTGSDSLTTSGVKFQALKRIGSTAETPTYLAGTTATTGQTFASIAETAGTHVPAEITAYKIDSAEVESTQNIYYTIKAWVASEGSGSQSLCSNVQYSTEEACEAAGETWGTENGVCSDESYTSQESCKDAGEIWGTRQTVGQSGGSFSFKLKIASTQIGF